MHYWIFGEGAGVGCIRRNVLKKKKDKRKWLEMKTNHPNIRARIQKINNSMTQLPITHPEYLMFPLGQMIEVPLVGTYSSGWLVNQSKDFLDQSLDQRDINISHHLNIK